MSNDNSPFGDIEINVDIEEFIPLADARIDRELDAASINMYDTTKKDDMSFDDLALCIGRAVINNIFVDAIELGMALDYQQHNDQQHNDQYHDGQPQDDNPPICNKD